MVDKQLKDETDKTTEEYRAGWKDGCEVGISGASNTFYKMFYRNNKIDGYRMSSSPEYRDAWDNSFGIVIARLTFAKNHQFGVQS